MCCNNFGLQTELWDKQWSCEQKEAPVCVMVEETVVFPHSKHADLIGFVPQSLFPPFSLHPNVLAGWLWVPVEPVQQKVTAVSGLHLTSWLQRLAQSLSLSSFCLLVLKCRTTPDPNICVLHSHLQMIPSISEMIQRQHLSYFSFRNQKVLLYCCVNVCVKVDDCLLQMKSNHGYK